MPDGVWDIAPDAYPQDREMMERLGLRIERFGRDWTDLGTVVVHEARPDENCPAATVKVEVAALPAQFWRFTVTRPRDEADTLADGTIVGVYEPAEVRVVTTGSGRFEHYWPTARMIAENVLEVVNG